MDGRHGARRLILMGRTALPPRSTWRTPAAEAHSGAIAAILQLEELGVSVRSLFADVGDETAVRVFPELRR